MKIFGIKRILGLAAIYGAVQYAKKNGGAKNAFNGLLEKAKDLAGKVKDEVGQVASKSSQAGDLSSASVAREPADYSSTSGYSSGGSYTGGNGFGGGNNRGGSY